MTTLLIQDKGQYSWYCDYTLTQSVEDNTSTIAGKLRIHDDGSGTAFWGTPARTFTINIGGKTDSEGHTSVDFGVITDLDAVTFSFTFDHNADGTHSAVSVTASVSGLAVSAGFPVPTSAGSPTISLPTIPRATVPTLSNSSREIGESTTITLDRASDDFTHDITYAFGSLTGQTSGLSSSTGVVTSATFTVPQALVSEMVGQSSKTLTFTVVTKDGSTTIGSKTVQLTVTPANGTVYQRPTVTVGVVRALSDGTSDDDGTCAKVSIEAAVTSVLVSTEQNTLTWKTEVSSDNGSSWDQLGTGTVSSHGLTLDQGTTYTDSDPDTSGTQEFATTSGYLFRVTITDHYSNTAVQVVRMSTAFAIVDFYDGGGDPDATGLAVGALFNTSLGSRLQVGGAALLPIGTHLPGEWGTTAPAGFVLANGATLNIADYPLLAAHYEDVYGASNHHGGDGSTTFAVPDTRQRVYANQGGTGDLATLGGTAGALTHDHDLSDAGQAQVASGGNGSTYFHEVATEGYTANFVVSGNRTSSSLARATGSALTGQTDAASTLQPTFICRYVIRAE